MIYKIPCRNCDLLYVGETDRPLRTKVKEHCKEVGEYYRSIHQSRKDKGGKHLQHICNH